MYLFFPAVLETKLRASSLPGECSSNRVKSLVLIFYILRNSARLSFCKARVVSFSFVTCGPVLDLTDPRQILLLGFAAPNETPEV